MAVSGEHLLVEFFVLLFFSPCPDACMKDGMHRLWEMPWRQHLPSWSTWHIEDLGLCHRLRCPGTLQHYRENVYEPLIPHKLIWRLSRLLGWKAKNVQQQVTDWTVFLFCKGNQMILSTIWNKQAQVNFQTLKNLHAPVGWLQFVAFEKFSSAYLLQNAH